MTRLPIKIVMQLPHKWLFDSTNLDLRVRTQSTNLWRNGVYLNAVDGSCKDERLVDLIVFTHLFPDRERLKALKITQTTDLANKVCYCD